MADVLSHQILEWFVMQQQITDTDPMQTDMKVQSQAIFKQLSLTSELNASKITN